MDTDQKGVQLTFTNAAFNRSVPPVVIFQRNNAGGSENNAVAWKVITNCGYYDYRRFVFSNLLYVNIRDCYGNYTPLVPAYAGDFFKVVKTPAGCRLVHYANDPRSKEIGILNGLNRGAIAANLYRGHGLCAVWRQVIPGQAALFDMDRRIGVQTARAVKEGCLFTPAANFGKGWTFDLSRLRSAEINLYGGGAGKWALPFAFGMNKR